MPRPSYKQLYLEEKAKRAEVAEKTKGVMRENFAKVKEAKERAALVLENQDKDRQTMEIIYLERIAELQREVTRLQHRVADLTPGEAHHVELAKRGNSGS